MRTINLSFLFLLLLAIVNVKAGVISNILSAQQNSSKNNIYFGGSKSSTLDIYTNGNNSKNKHVVIFVHGGAWVSGNKAEYQVIGNLLASNDYVAVLPNYLLYPVGHMDEMVNDVYQSILWTYNNISQYGDDKNRIILSGHSAGAHLSILTVIKSTLQLSNKGKKLEPLPKLEKLVLFNGPYDFNDYDLISKYISSQIALSDGFYDRLLTVLFTSEFISPTNILKSYKDDSIDDLGVPKIVFYAADSDQLVPEASAVNLIEQLRRVSPKTSINYNFNQGNGYDHFTLIVGCQLGNSSLQKMFIDLIEQ